MPLLALGINHTTAPVEVREQIAFAPEQMVHALQQAQAKLAIDEVATGEVWLGVAALDKQLVDELQTSDEYLATKAKTAEVFHLHYAERKSLQERVGLAASGSVDRVLLTWWNRLTQQRFW